jgi:O-antigen ligase
VTTAVLRPGPGPYPATAATANPSRAEERLALVSAAAGVALVPLLVPAGPSNIAPVDLVITVAVAACLVWAGASGRRLRFPYVVPALLLIVGGALGALFGPVPGTGAVALLQDVWLLGWCWSLVNIARSAGNLRVLLATWAYSAMAWAVALYIGLFAGLQQLTGQIERQGTRVQLTLDDPSYAANYFFISIMIIWATATPRRRAWRVVGYLLLVPALFLTGSNSGMVSLVVGTSAAATIGIYRRFGGVMAVVAAAVMLLGAFALASNVSLTRIQERAHGSHYAFVRDGIGRGTSVEQRGSLLTESLSLYRHGTPFGAGPVSTKTRLLNEQAPFEKEAHNDYLASLIERGIIGFAGAMLLLGSLGFRALAICRDRLSPGFAAVVSRPNALFGAVLGTLVAGTVYELFHVRHVWALFAIVAALYIWGRE